MANKPNIIAFQLPQFHTFPENDAWWGEGFTEWTNTRKASKIYPSHYQPREPLDDHYYDLTDIDEMLWQMHLAKQYGIYGFCYYHYWFKGKLLLNKPLELIRDYDGAKLPYCFCWANEPWTRTWEDKATTVLMPQDYGNESDWEKHFQYLLSFFRDSAYIMVDGAPVLVIYRSNSIPNVQSMAEYFIKRAKEEGYNGLHLIEEFNCFQDKAVMTTSKGVLQFEPLFSMTLGRSKTDSYIYKIESIIFNRVYKAQKLIYGYDRLWRRVISNAGLTIQNKDFYPGAFVDWDNTARKGKKGRIVLGATPKKFGKYLKMQLDKATHEGDGFVFINAWNEWGEGTYLEPDKKYEYAYLEALKNAVDHVGC